ncbi:hypothetical protein PMAYCL1PPCAC_32110, partial [Pristionchus mayeri]
SAMSARSSFHLFFVVLAAVEARVTFDYSEVLQANDFDSPFDEIPFSCDMKYGCTVYVDSPDDSLQVIDEHGSPIASFTDIFGNNPNSLEGLTLPPGKKYKLRNDYGKSKANFVFYAVRVNLAADINCCLSVAAPQGTDSITITGRNRYATVISSAISIELGAFKGSYPVGYPKIYTTGFDLGDGDYWKPAFQGRSQGSVEKSTFVIAAPILTIDFGPQGNHSVQVNNRQCLSYIFCNWLLCAASKSSRQSESHQGCRLVDFVHVTRVCVMFVCQWSVLF